MTLQITVCKWAPFCAISALSETGILLHSPVFQILKNNLIILEFLMILGRWNRPEWFCRKIFCTGVNCPSPRLNSGGRRCTTHRAKTSGVKATEHNARRPSTADICIGWAAQYNTQPSLQLAKFNVLGETRIMLESFVPQPHGNTQLLLWVRC